MRTLFVSDLDGTLLDNSSRISTVSVCLLNEAISSGAMFTVATARTPATVVSLLEDVDMRLPAIVMTGGALYDFDKGRLVRPRFMEADVARSLVDDWRNSGLGCFHYTLDEEGVLHVYHIGPLSALECDFMKGRSGTRCKVFHVPADGCSELPDDLGRTMLFFGMQPTEPARQLYEKVCETYSDSIVPQFYHDIFGDAIGEIEMFPKDVSKASALEKLASDVGADRLVVFGDNVNDIPMMRMADMAIAVDNAKDSVKEVASEVIGANDTDAVARFIRNESR